MNNLLVMLLLASGAMDAQPYRAFWADAFHRGFKSPAEIDEMVDNLTAAKANAIFVQMRRRGDSYYLRSLEPPAQDPDYSPNFDALDYLIRRAHDRGIEVHGWFVVGPLWRESFGTPQDPRHAWVQHGPAATGDGMWMTIDSTGTKVSSALDMGHPDAARYLADVITYPANFYELDGIHLDYIRYPEDANYGWNPKAVERFQRLENRTGRPEASDPKWSDFRRRQVTDLVRQICLRAGAMRPSIKVSAALITWGNGPATDAEYRAKDAYSRVFQDWRSWLEEGIIDLGLPMNYFNEAKYAAWMDRWLEFQKDRQYGRAILSGFGVYLNTIEDTLAQLRRAQAPSAAGNRLLGVAFYSYASTNKDPARPNDEFYRAVADAFGEPAPLPALPWKAKPERGRIWGRLTVSPGPAWLQDGAVARIESDTTPGVAFTTATDSGGFFGAVELPPDRYRVRIERGGLEVYRTVAQDVRAGASVNMEILLRAEDFSAVLPRVLAAQVPVAAPSDVVTLNGAALARASETAAAVPLPLELGGAQVLVNGVAAPLFTVSPERIQFQIPCIVPADAWNIVVRHSGLESAVFRLTAVPANPVIAGVRRVNGQYLEIYATGLGVTDPPLAAGLGMDGKGPYNLTPAVVVRLGETVVPPLYAGLAPWLPGRYQVNIRLPEGVTSGELRLQVGEIASPPFRF